VGRERVFAGPDSGHTVAPRPHAADAVAMSVRCSTTSGWRHGHVHAEAAPGQIRGHHQSARTGWRFARDSNAAIADKT
jgi:hypothetical protein